MKELIREYERISARQFDYGMLMLFGIAISILTWFLCGDYQVGKLFVLIAGGASCASLAVAVVYTTIRKKIAMRAILRGLGVGGANR